MKPSENYPRDQLRGYLKRAAQHRYRARLVFLSLWLVVMGGFWGYSRRLDLSPFELVWLLIDILTSSGYGPLLFLCVFMLRPLLFFSAALLMATAGYLYGPAWGTVYTIVGSNLSALFAYFLGYYFGWMPVEGTDRDNRLQRRMEQLRDNSFEAVLAMRFFFIPHDVVSYLAGFLRVDWKPFLVATALGTLPSTLAFVLVGSSIEGTVSGPLPAVDHSMLMLSAAFFLPCLVFSHYLRRRERPG